MTVRGCTMYRANLPSIQNAGTISIVKDLSHEFYVNWSRWLIIGVSISAAMQTLLLLAIVNSLWLESQPQYLLDMITGVSILSLTTAAAICVALNKVETSIKRHCYRL